jgi:hypothetical protein
VGGNTRPLRRIRKTAASLLFRAESTCGIFGLKSLVLKAGQHDLAFSLHNTAKSENQILDEHLATVCLLRNEKICAINTYLSDVEMVNAFFG